MEDEIVACDCILESRKVEKIAFDEGEACIFLRFGKERALPGAEVIECRDSMSGSQQPIHEIAADKPGSAGNETIHAALRVAVSPTGVVKMFCAFRSAHNSTLVPSGSGIRRSIASIPFSTRDTSDLPLPTFATG